MPKRELIVLLWDAFSAVEEAELVISEVNTYEAFLDSALHQRALERIFEIIGESLAKASKLNNELAITDLQKIIGLRHVIAHDYYSITIERIWNVAKENLPLLKTEIGTCIEKENQRLFGTSHPNLNE